MKYQSVGPTLKLRFASHVTENLRAFIKLSSVSDEKQVSSLNTVEHYFFFFHEIGRWKEAELAESEVLQRRGRMLGDEHPSTILAINNLALTLRGQGKLDEAAQMFREVLEKMKWILGDKHPDTISAMNNLASTLGDQGKTDEAAQMKREVLEKMKRVLGDEHPSTISAMNNLASAFYMQGKLDEAARMFRDVLERRKKVLGGQHLDTIAVGDLLHLIETSETSSVSQSRVAPCAEKQHFGKKIYGKLRRLRDALEVISRK